ncbi:MAG: alpha-hydroxy-acid oxidizing protein [Rhodospirillales bacterium]|nr:alpha-hydroxy-acid oxidizing protein [Rhodospirillales bacterium]
MRANAADEFLNLHEIVKAARLHLNQFSWDYLIGGVESETTLKRNRLAIDSLAFRPRVLVDVREVDAGARFFGRAIRLPVALAPVGSLQSFHPDGGSAVARGAGAFNVPMFLSSVSDPGLEAAAKAGEGPKVFQLYVRGDDDFIVDHMKRAEDAGYDAFCITVDTAVLSRRERDIAKRWAKPWHARLAGMEYQAGLDWATLERVRARQPMKLIIKGIATAEDAARACEMGIEGVYVSNHGGRQLDHGRGALDVLGEVVEAVGGRARVLIDGGFSRGTDIVKALALGADTVCLGRLYLYGLAAAGPEGVVRVLEILEDEIERTMALLGVTSLAGLTPAHVHAAPPVVAPGVHAAFPHLTLDEGY